MIIFYNKKTGDIIGTEDGRVHSEENIKSAWIQPSNVPKEDIVKYVVPFAPVYEEVEQEVHRAILVDKKKNLYRKKTVKEKIKRVKELAPDVPFADDIYAFEKGTKKILKHKVKLDNNGKVVGFEEKKL